MTALATVNKIAFEILEVKRQEGKQTKALIGFVPNYSEEWDYEQEGAGQVWVNEWDTITGWSFKFIKGEKSDLTEGDFKELIEMYKEAIFRY